MELNIKSNNISYSFDVQNEQTDDSRTKYMFTNLDQQGDYKSFDVIKIGKRYYFSTGNDEFDDEVRNALNII